MYEINNDLAKNSRINKDKYFELYAQSINKPDEFWGTVGKRIDWIKPYTQVKDVSFAKEDLHINWYKDGTLNASVNCIDRHLHNKANQTAIIFEADNPSLSSLHITYQTLHDEVCRFANLLKSRVLQKAERR